MDEANLKSIRFVALKLLAARAITEIELRRKLLDKGFKPEEIDLVTVEFRRKRMLDDSGIADDLIENAVNRKLEGRRQIRSRLLRRGVEESEIEQKLKENYSSESEFAAALEFAKKKQRSIADKPFPIQQRRIGGALERRGFPSGIIIKVLTEIQSSADNLEQMEYL